MINKPPSACGRAHRSYAAVLHAEVKTVDRQAWACMRYFTDIAARVPIFRTYTLSQPILRLHGPGTGDRGPGYTLATVFPLPQLVTL
jgi:hypothetical protein